MATYVDGVLKEWGDRLFYTKPKARPAPKTTCGYKPKSKPKPKPSGASPGQIRAALRRVARRVPEVVVKIPPGRRDPETGIRNIPCKDMRSIKAHLDYISRNGDVPLEDENGQLIQGKEQLTGLREDWRMTGAKAIPETDGYRREAYNIVLSMPPGVDRTSVKDAAREFAREVFGNHQYVFAAHDDEDHPHVHLCVKAVSRDLHRLNPRKADLQGWREVFAEKLRDQGIEANATNRALRGQARKAERQEVRQIADRGGSSTVRKGRVEAVEREAQSGYAPHPAEAALAQQRVQVMRQYGKLAEALAGSEDREDRQLAVQLVDMARTMPPPKTAHRLAVEERVRPGPRPAGEGRAVSQERKNPEQDRGA